MQFYSTDHFARYNMFNRFFYDGDASRQQYASFMSRPNLAVLMDPPFGGLVDVLARRVQSMMDDRTARGPDQLSARQTADTLSVFWIFPYFMEAKIVGALPDFSMLDYKVQ